MKIAVAGLRHLGCVTAACLAKAGYEVMGYDPDIHLVKALQHHEPPVYEPGLTPLLNEVIQNNQLKITHNLHDLVNHDTVWITFDTPIQENDLADIDSVTDHIKSILTVIAHHSLVIISSQLPAGTIKTLQEHCSQAHPAKNINFACIPENLRLGKAIQIFTQPDRIIIGLDNQDYHHRLVELLSPFSSQLIFMSIISAEMVKHAINGFLALSVTYINEIAEICERVGANSTDIERAMKSESRIGASAYVRPGACIGGGTLMRDIHYLKTLSEPLQRQTSVISATIESNHAHQSWTCNKLKRLLHHLHDKKVTVLGLAYKAGTASIQRSNAITTCTWLHQQGVTIQAYDPVVQQLPDDLSTYIHIKNNLQDALQDTDAVIIATEWPEFQALTADMFSQTAKRPVIVDPNRFIAKHLEADSRIKYYSVGVPS